MTKKQLETKGLRGKKKLMVEAMHKAMGNISKATQSVGISRVTHYKWLKEDSAYADAMANLPEFVIDYVEHKMFKLIEKENPAAIFFYLKTQAKHRGYIEKQEVEHSGSAPVKVEFHGVDDGDGTSG